MRLHSFASAFLLAALAGGCSDIEQLTFSVPNEQDGGGSGGGGGGSGSGGGQSGGLCAAKSLSPWSRKSVGVGGVVTFNEIMYRPAGDPNLEWVELFNPMTIEVDVSGFRLDGAVQFTFPKGTLIPGDGFLVVAADAALLAKAVGAPVAIGSYTGALPDDGGSIQLWNNAGRLLDTVDYDAAEPWPVIPDGSGASLAKKAPRMSSERAEAWTGSTNVAGTPGAANFAGSQGAPKPSNAPPAGLAFNEVGGADGGAFWLELRNLGAAAVDTGGYLIRSTTGAEHTLEAGALAPGERRRIDESSLGFGADVGDALFLLAPDLKAVVDGVAVMNTPRGRSEESPGPWFYPDVATPGAPNEFIVNDGVVINEIMYDPPPVTAADGSIAKSPLEWIELYNRGQSAVDVGGFQLVDALEYTIPAGTVIKPGAFLVVAKDAKAVAAAYPDLPAGMIIGDWKGGLGDSGENLALRDACGNPVDAVPYGDRGRWPSLADGGGSSLELRDARAENSAPEAWAASDEAAASTWQTISYEGALSPSMVGPDGQWQELVIGLLDEGSALLDDIHVVRDPNGAATELLQNGAFEAGGAQKWRLLGNHRRSEVIVDPTDPANHVLRLVATGPTEHMHNHIETTLAGGAALTNGQTYRISLRAKWLGGSNRLNTRLYFNRLAKTTALTLPARHGTPGAPNSAAEMNIGPTYSGLRHTPIVPAANTPVTVSIDAGDPDGVGGLTLWYVVSGGAAASVVMASQGDGHFTGVVPGQKAGSLVQFYVTGKDALGASSDFPARGPASRAIYRVDDGLAATNGLHNLRILVVPSDAAFLFDAKNLMSNDYVGATVIDQEKEAYYDVGVRLKGSERGRPETVRLGFALRFPSDEPFRGAYRSVMVDRSEGVGFGQREMLFNQAMNHAGSATSQYDDIIHVVAPLPQHTGPAHLQLARFSDVLLDGQFPSGSDGMLFEYELIYFPLTTDTGTPEGYKMPQPDSVIGTPIQSLGPDKEAYRLNFIIKNNRYRDDYSGFMAFAGVFGQSGAAFNAKIGDVADVDEWLRAFAFATLSGAIDNYADGAQHNGNFYVRPTDGRALYFPHDLDFYGGSPQSPVVASGDLAKLMGTPERARAYYGHLYDIISSSYNGAYMAFWCDRLGKLLPGQDFAGHLQFITARADWVMNGAPNAVMKAVPKVAFQVTTNGGAPLAVAAPSVTLDGSGWLDVAEVRRSDVPGPVTLTWPSSAGWQATLPLSCGVNPIGLDAFDRHGQAVGSDTITVTRTGAGCP